MTRVTHRLDTVFFVWIFLSTFQNISRLQDDKQAKKLSLFVSFRRTLVFVAIAAALSSYCYRSLSESTFMRELWKWEWLWGTARGLRRSFETGVERVLQLVLTLSVMVAVRGGGECVVSVESRRCVEGVRAAHSDCDRRERQ